MMYVHKMELSFDRWRVLLRLYSSGFSEVITKDHRPSYVFVFLIDMLVWWLMGNEKPRSHSQIWKKGGMLFVFHSLASALIYHADINIGWLLPGWLQSVGLLYQQAFIHPAEVKLWNTGPQMHPWSVHEKRKAPLGLTRIIAINVMKTLPSSGVTVPLFHCGWL